MLRSGSACTELSSSYHAAIDLQRVADRRPGPNTADQSVAELGKWYMNDFCPVFSFNCRYLYGVFVYSLLSIYLIYHFTTRLLKFDIKQRRYGYYALLSEYQAHNNNTCFGLHICSYVLHCIQYRVWNFSVTANESIPNRSVSPFTRIIVSARSSHCRFNFRGSRWRENDAWLVFFEGRHVF